MSSENETPAPIRLNVKLVRRSIQQKAEKLLSGTPGLKSVVPTFPDEADDELSRHFIVEVEPTAVASALEDLQKNPAIEYAEPSAKRKLIR